jgi:hypothetical protein
MFPVIFHSHLGKDKFQIVTFIIMNRKYDISLVFASPNELNVFYGLTVEGTLAQVKINDCTLQKLAPLKFQTILINST